MISIAPNQELGADGLVGARGVVRLDLAENPYGPCPAALEAVHATLPGPTSEIAARLKQGLQRAYGVPADSILLFDRIESANQGIMEAFSGPVVTFPPSALAYWNEQTVGNRSTVQLARGPGRAGALDSEIASDLPWDGIALIESPANPLGSLLRATDAVRLARACRLVVIDERFSEFAGHSLLGFAREFENVVILRSFDAWAGLPAYSCAWAVMSPQEAAVLAPRLSAPAPEVMAAALATLESAEAMSVTLRLVREERSRLYRSLRKFAAFEPLPSWGPFVTARVGFGLRDAIIAALRARRVHVHAPAEVGLENYIRFGLGTRSAMEQLYDALRQIMPATMDDALLHGRADADCLTLGGEKLIETEAGKIQEVVQPAP